MIFKEFSNNYNDMKTKLALMAKARAPPKYHMQTAIFLSIYKTTRILRRYHYETLYCQ